DEELDQLSHAPLDSVAASMFIGENIDFFGEDLLITGYQEQAQVARVTLQRSEDPMEGSLTLVFEQKPLALKKWTVVDAQGIITTVSLVAPKFGETFKDELFKVENQPLKRRED
ncbi:outer membrane lipoprotein carrier protein LolA, partial [Pseudomonadota bacterium]